MGWLGLLLLVFFSYSLHGVHPRSYASLRSGCIFLGPLTLALWPSNSKHTTQNIKQNKNQNKNKTTSFILYGPYDVTLHEFNNLSSLLLYDAKATSPEIIKIRSPHGKYFKASNQCQPNTWHKL